MELGPDNFPLPSELITDIDADIYDLRETVPPYDLEDHAVPVSAMKAMVRQFTVEIWEMNEHQSNAAFKFNIEPFEEFGDDYSCCLISTEAVLNTQGNHGPGACWIQVGEPILERETTRVAFQFKMNRSFSVGEVVRVIQGTAPRLPARMRSDLTVFHFRQYVEEDGDTYYSGCRDWM